MSFIRFLFISFIFISTLSAKNDVSKWDIGDWDDWLTNFQKKLQPYMDYCKETQRDKALVDELIKVWDAGATCHLKYQLDALENPEKCIKDAEKKSKAFIKKYKTKLKNK